LSGKNDHLRFDDLDYEGFRALAKNSDPALSKYNRIGFPDSYRAGFEKRIFADILRKLPILNETERTVLDIGPGCSDLATYLIDTCRRNGHTLVLCDSEEMLERLPDEKFIRKISGPFPASAGAIAVESPGFDAILCYSVLHYFHPVSDLGQLPDFLSNHLNSPGDCLIGDIPNISMRKRFFSSEAGRAYHRSFTGRDEEPEHILDEDEDGRIDDEVVLDLLKRFRRSGLDAYVMPQPSDLPMANRREDIVVRRA